jgi:hypothetical protein
MYPVLVLTCIVQAKGTEYGDSLDVSCIFLIELAQPTFVFPFPLSQHATRFSK